MPVTTDFPSFPDAPSRMSDTPSVFASKSDAFVAAMEAFSPIANQVVEEMNDVESNITTLESTASTAASSANTSAINALNSEILAEQYMEAAQAAVAQIDAGVEGVANIAALRAMTPSGNGQFINLLGYYSVGDNYSRIGIYDSSMTAADNGGSIFRPDSIPSGEPGRWYFPKANTPRDFGAKGDGVSDDTAAMQSLFDSGIKHINLDGLMYRVDTLVFPSERVIVGNGATITFTSATLGADFKGMMRTKIIDLTLNSQAGGAILAEFGNDGSNDTYDNSFICVDFKGNSGVNTQIGLKMSNCYINTFTKCHVLNFGVNIQFGTQANNNNFLGCSVRSNQTNNIVLVRILGGVANNFHGGDIENCVSWIDNGAATSVEDNTSCFFSGGVYFEAMTSPSIIKFGLISIDRCFISEPRFAIYGTSELIFTNNKIQKHGSSFILYFMDNSISNLKIHNNKVKYLSGSEATTGLFYRGFPGGYQYVSNGNISSPTWTNGSFIFQQDCSIEQSRVYNVNNGDRIMYIQKSATDLYFGGNINTQGNISTTGSTSGVSFAGYQWNQSHLQMGSGSNVYHFWVHDGGTGSVTLRGKKGAPTFNTDGVSIATIG